MQWWDHRQSSARERGADTALNTSSYGAEPPPPPPALHARDNRSAARRTAKAAAIADVDAGLRNARATSARLANHVSSLQDDNRHLRQQLQVFLDTHADLVATNHVALHVPSTLRYREGAIVADSQAQ